MAVGELLVEDFVLEWPNGADMVIRGRTNFVEFNRNYPEGWSIEVLRIVAEGNTAVSEVRVPHPAGWVHHYALSFLEVEGGRLTRGREYSVEERYSNQPLSVLAGSSRCSDQHGHLRARVCGNVP